MKHTALVLLVASCAYRLPEKNPHVETLPARLSDAQRKPARAYTPRFELWSDGATKRRAIHLPEGSHIDTTDLNEWRFPVGTELWKEFSLDGRRLETRLLTHVSEGEWLGVAYVWNAEGTEAFAAPEGAQNVLGTTHDVPEARACFTCHGAHASVVLGFSAVQLAGSETARALSLPPIDVPDEARGRLHVDCGSCHHSNLPERHRAYRPPPGLDLWWRVDGGAPLADPKALLARYRGDGLKPRMPPLATERFDEHGYAVVERALSAPPPATPARSPR